MNKNKNRKMIAALIVLVLVLQDRPVPVEALDVQYRLNVMVTVDGTEIGEIAAVENNYENNLYISLRGLAGALNGTRKMFAPEIEKQRIDITTGTEYAQPSYAWEPEEVNTSLRATAAKYEMYADGEERKYYSFILQCNEEYDAFLTPVSLAMLFDMDMEVKDGKVELHPAKDFAVTAEEIERSGILQGVNSLLIGDGSSGEILYGYDSEEVALIASTTKLMTYFVFMDAVAAGECALTDTAVVSEKAARLSVGSDGVTPMLEGSVVTMTDLLYGMLLLSSNECALTIAEHVSGSEEAFVARMNGKAQELGLENAEFYNCHGLPSYDDQLIPAKVQNHMTAEEMFRLAAAITERYPQITEITATKSYDMVTLGVEARNNNALVYNMREAVGLKTGTTNKAGACLVTCLAAEKDGEKHTLIVVLFGADGDANRGIISEMAARYALDALAEGAFEGQKEPEGIPRDPEQVVRELIRLQME